MVSYPFVVFIHIAAAVVLLGTSILGEPAVRAAARRATSPAEILALLRFGRPMAVISPVAALAILASGIYLASVGRFWTLGWIQVATAFWVVNAVLAATVMRPAVERVARVAADTAEPSIGAALDGVRRSAAWSWSVDVMAANDAAMLYLMSMKPGLAGSVAVVVLANLGVAGGRYLFGTPRPRATPASPTPGL